MQTYASTIENLPERVSMTAERFNVKESTVRKFLSMSFDDIKKLNNPLVRKTRLKPIYINYLNMIYKMIRDNHSREVIYWYVTSKGFKGTLNQLSNTISYLAKNNFKITYSKLRLSENYSKGSIVIKRNDLLKEITARNKKYKHNKTIQEYLELIYEKYPIVKVVNDLYSEFHSTIMGDDPDKLDGFISKYETKKEKDENGKQKIIYDSPISSFIEGLKKDITPVKNAISFPESSGFVEGNNCKFKLIKRIVYGRAKLVNLFYKSYLCFSMKKKNFNLKEAYSLTNKK